MGRRCRNTSKAAPQYVLELDDFGEYRLRHSGTGNTYGFNTHNKPTPEQMKVGMRILISAVKDAELKQQVT